MGSKLRKHLIVSFGIFLVCLDCTKDEIYQAGVPYPNQVGTKKAWAGWKTWVHIPMGKTPVFSLVFFVLCGIFKLYGIPVPEYITIAHGNLNHLMTICADRLLGSFLDKRNISEELRKSYLCAWLPRLNWEFSVSLGYLKSKLFDYRMISSEKKKLGGTKWWKSTI